MEVGFMDAQRVQYVDSGDGHLGSTVGNNTVDDDVMLAGGGTNSDQDGWYPSLRRPNGPDSNVPADGVVGGAAAVDLGGVAYVSAVG